MDTGLQTLGALNALTTYAGNPPPPATPADLPGAGPFPVSPTANTTNFPQNITSADLAIVTTATLLHADQRMTFAVVGNTNPVAATAQITNAADGTSSVLTITPLAPGMTTTPSRCRQPISTGRSRRRR